MQEKGRGNTGKVEEDMEDGGKNGKEEVIRLIAERLKRVKECIWDHSVTETAGLGKEVVLIY